MIAYYNEYDLYAAKWLENLIKGGHIAPGVVDTRSIEDVRPSDLVGFKQCHFFAGIGVWSYALRAAGWSDDRPVWTGSCPCQPFSTAGQGAAFADERHLWPAFHHLIKERKPECILGEQVASKDADAWIDLVQDDMEALGYAFGAVAFPSASVGAPHIRDRTYWAGKLETVGQADSNNKGLERRREMRERAIELPTWPSGMVGGMADNQGERCGEAGKSSGRSKKRTCDSGEHGWLANSEHKQQQGGIPRPGEEFGAHGSGATGEFTGRGTPIELGTAGTGGVDIGGWAGPTNGLWNEADWLFCRDGKWRPVEPGTFPLVNGNTSRVGPLRAYGNAINAEQARIFIEVLMEHRP